MSPIIERRNPRGGLVYGIRWTDETGVDRRRFSRRWTKTQARAELAKVEQNLASGVATRVTMTVSDLFHAKDVSRTWSGKRSFRASIRLRHRPAVGPRVRAGSAFRTVRLHPIVPSQYPTPGIRPRAA